MEKIIRLSEYATSIGYKYQTVWKKYKAGMIPGAFRNECGRVFVKIDENIDLSGKVAIYARVSSSENKTNLEKQAQRLTQYAVMRGYNIVQTVMEIGSGINDKRPKLEKLLRSSGYTKIIVEHKDRLTRFGFNYLETLLSTKGVSIEIVNPSVNDESNLMEDLVSIIYSFSARMYGLRKSMRKTEKIIEILNKKDDGV
jgi:transposon, resolvase